MLARIIEASDHRAHDAEVGIDALRDKAENQPPTRGFESVLRSGQFGVVAEIKRRSPSVGDIDADLDPVAQAIAYEAGGADAISVLTEPTFFGGSLADLVAVREAVSVPVLRKDFTRNVAQLVEARAFGADAALLIVATLAQHRLFALCEAAREIEIDVIVEVHSAVELDRALDAGASMIGVNNRNLKTFETDLGVAESLSGALPNSVVSIAESGVANAEGAARMRAAGYDAVLVGEALVRTRDPQAMVTELRGRR